jgi:hypothetical protein
LVTKPDAIEPPILVLSSRRIHTGFPLIPAILVNTLITVLLSYTGRLGHPHFREKQLIPTLAFRPLLVDEIELFCQAAPDQISDLLLLTWDVTYTMGLEFLIDERTGEAGTIWIISADHVDAYETLLTRVLWP